MIRPVARLDTTWFGSSRGRECLLEWDDLTRVIQVVLRRAGELGVRRLTIGSAAVWCNAC
jgi:hypothetical protein